MAYKGHAANIKETTQIRERRETLRSASRQLVSNLTLKNPQGLWELEWLLMWVPLFYLNVFFFIYVVSFMFAVCPL